MARAGEIVEVDARGVIGADGGHVGPNVADRGDVVEMRTDGDGVGEVPIVDGYLAAVCYPKRSVIGRGCKGGGKCVGCGTHSGDD